MFLFFFSLVGFLRWCQISNSCLCQTANKHEMQREECMKPKVIESVKLLVPHVNPIIPGLQLIINHFRT